jgi:hypothetical protein
VTRAVWTWTAVAVGVLLGGWVALAAATPPPHLRSRHADPVSVAPATVAVTDDGTLFHRQGCTYIHGPVAIESGARAIAQGYTPCTRCLRRGIQ